MLMLKSQNKFLISFIEFKCLVINRYIRLISSLFRDTRAWYFSVEVNVQTQKFKVALV